jgi:hypothetical protein
LNPVGNERGKLTFVEALKRRPMRLIDNRVRREYGNQNGREVDKEGHKRGVECKHFFRFGEIVAHFPCRIFNYTGSFSREEVAEVFLAPISFFETTPAKVYTVDWKPVFPEDFPFDKIYGGRNYGWRPRKSRIRFYEYEGRVIWGMTARIIENYVRSTRK